jgi:hypothetical protein
LLKRNRPLETVLVFEFVYTTHRFRLCGMVLCDFFYSAALLTYTIYNRQFILTQLQLSYPNTSASFLATLLWTLHVVDIACSLIAYFAADLAIMLHKIRLYE